MKILWLSYYYLPHVGGGTWGTYFLSSLLSKNGHEIHLIIPNINHKLSISHKKSIRLEKKNDSKVHKTLPIPRFLGPLISIFFSFITAMKKNNQFDVIIVQYHPLHLLTPVAIFLGKIFNIPVVVRADDVFRDMGTKNPGIIYRLTKLTNFVNECFVKYADVFLVVCSENVTILKSRLRNCESNCNIKINFNGVSLSKFDSAPNNLDAKKSLGIAITDRVILFLGRFSGAEYGIEILLKAFSKISDRNSHCLLILIGDKLKPSQSSLIKSLGIGKKIKVYGSKAHDEIIKFVSASDVCIGPLMPTRTIPLKVLEYMSSAKPVITGENSVSADLAINNFNCVIVRPKQIFVIKAVLKLLQDKNFANSLGKNAKKTVQKFDWNCISEDLLQHILECIRNYRA